MDPPLESLKPDTDSHNCASSKARKQASTPAWRPACRHALMEDLPSLGPCPSIHLPGHGATPVHNEFAEEPGPATARGPVQTWDRPLQVTGIHCRVFLRSLSGDCPMVAFAAVLQVCSFDWN